MRCFAAVVFDEKRMDQVDEFFARDYLDPGAVPGQAPGLEGAKRKWAISISATPDMRVQFEDLLAEGDKVAARWSWDGTQQGELPSIPPTGKRFRISGLSIHRLADGKMVELWEQQDTLSLMQQLGVLPTPEQGGM